MPTKKISSHINKTIWIDLDNSPHVPFFAPIIKLLEEKGLNILVTARDCFQTCGLANLMGLSYDKIGRHYGKKNMMKIFGTIVRAFQLIPTAKKNQIDMGISHGSRSQVICCSFLRKPVIVLLDYEFSRIFEISRKTWFIVPDVISKDLLPNKERVLYYPGLKEDVYTHDFKPSLSALMQLDLKRDDFIVTIRPPATEAHYHNPESELLFEEVINFLGRCSQIRMVILPRNQMKQTEYIRRKWPNWCNNGKIIIPNHVVNGLDLIWFSDFVVSGGGTMNREAAALGVPVYSIFRGKIGAVDRYLSNEGRLTFLETIEDIRTKLRVERRQKGLDVPKRNRAALDTIVNNIMDVLERTS